MADIQYYERVIKSATGTKKLLPKLLMIAGYIVLVSIWLVVTVRVGLSASLLMLLPLSVLTAVVLTWKYTTVEYEYSFNAGTLTFSKIYGKSKRQMIFEADLKCLVSVTAYSEQKIESTDVRKVVNAVPASSSENPCICVFEENEQRSCIILDCDEMTLKIFKFFRMSAVDRSVYDNLKASE